jgi:Proline dehydrogenase
MLSTARNSRKILKSLSKPLSSLPLYDGVNHFQPHASNTGKSKKPTFEPKDSRPYKDKTISELLRSLLVYQLCQFQPLVQHGEKILDQTRRVFGDKVTDAIVKMTFFQQFCGGEDHHQVVGKMHSLQQSGIGSILDYAAEDEGSEESSSDTSKYSTNMTTANVMNQPAREYDYKSEELCDARVETFHHCIQTVHDAGQGKQFSAIKLTGLGNPKLLKRMTDYANQIKATIHAHDKDTKGFLTREEFIHAHRSLFDDKKRIDALLHRFDANNLESIDYIDWCSISFALDLEEPELQTSTSSSMVNIIPGIVKFTNEEIDLIHALQVRAHSVAKKASDLNVSLLIDAEQSWFQPAIDVISIGLQQTFNASNDTTQPVIFNTYQCYLKDSLDRIKEDLARSKRRGYHFGAKLVRGAYMHRERTRAAELGYPSPIHDSFQETNDCYNDSVDFLLRQISNNNVNNHTMNKPLIEVMCATHNKESIEKAIDTLEMLGGSDALPEENEQQQRKISSFLSFAQLYGMSDDLTIPLGKNGYHVYKYVPYGKVKEVIPYMLRRAQENGDVLGKSQYERQLILNELMERPKAFF